MGIFDRVREGMGLQRPATPSAENPPADDQAIARYRYLLKTAPPEAIEQAHAEAFAQLTPDQRRRVLQQLAREVPESERSALLRSGDTPGALAQAATRAEIREPGMMERIFGGMPAAPGAMPGMGGLLAGTFLSSMAGTVLGSMIAQQFFQSHGDSALFGEDHAHGAFPEHHDRGSFGDDAGTSITHDLPDINPDFIDDVGNIDTWDV